MFNIPVLVIIGPKLVAYFNLPFLSLQKFSVHSILVPTFFSFLAAFNDDVSGFFPETDYTQSARRS